MLSRRSLILGSGAAFITTPALAFPISLRNPLAYPGGNPGVNYAHQASKNLVFSGVASGANAIDLLSGLAGTPTTLVSGSTIVGPATAQPNGAGNALFGVAKAVTDTNATLAAIFFGYQTASVSFPISVGSASSGNGLIINSNAIGWNNWNGSNPAASVTLTTSTPYFVVGSCTNSPSTCNIVVTNLQTGLITTATSAGHTQTSHDVNVVWGCANNLGNTLADVAAYPGQGYLAAAMYSTAYLSMPRLVRWAASPWDFWYPLPFIDTLLTEASKTSIDATKNCTITLLGVGPC